MPDVNFTVESARALQHAAVPTLVLTLHVAGDQADSIQNVLLQCQIQIETNRRRYSSAEQPALIDLFGTPDRWGETLRTMHWTRVNALVPAFDGHTSCDLQIPCTFDFNIAATKYFYALEEGEIPLLLLFSGTIFFRDDRGALQVTQIPWSKEARFRLPVTVWKQMMDYNYPNSAWFCLRRDVFDRLYHFKCQQGIPDWEQTIDRLLPYHATELRGEMRCRHD